MKSKAEYMKDYYDSNPIRREKKRALDRKYAAEHREEALVRASTYYQQNTEKIKKYQAIRRKEAKAKIAELLGGNCQRCNFSHLAALDFHHKDPATKSFRLSDAVMRTKKYTWQDIVDEVAKCELLCKNCHAIEHCTWED
jgi:hypothetical protein